MTTIYIIRHGESTHNAGIFKGEKLHEIPLTETGKKQAEKVAQKLKNIHFDVIFSSHYVRAQETAKIIANSIKLEHKVSSTIHERIFGDNYYKNRETVRAKMKEIFKKFSDKEKLQYKYSQDMESSQQGTERLMTFIKKVTDEYAGKTIMIVCHGNIMRSLLNLLGWCKFDELPERAIENTGYIRLETNGTKLLVTETFGVYKQTGVERIT